MACKDHHHLAPVPWSRHKGAPKWTLYSWHLGPAKRCLRSKVRLPLWGKPLHQAKGGGWEGNRRCSLPRGVPAHPHRNCAPRPSSPLETTWKWEGGRTSILPGSDRPPSPVVPSLRKREINPP